LINFITLQVPSRWSPTRTRRDQLRATSPAPQRGLSYNNIENAETHADPWPLINHDFVSGDRDDLNISKRYEKFVEAGLQSKSGVNALPMPDEVIHTRFNQYYMPCHKQLEQTKRLQTNIFYENTNVNKLDPRPLRQFGKEDRPHHMAKTKVILHAFPNYPHHAHF
jgi:hypothetical protein